MTIAYEECKVCDGRGKVRRVCYTNGLTLDYHCDPCLGSGDANQWRHFGMDAPDALESHPDLGPPIKAPA